MKTIILLFLLSLLISCAASKKEAKADESGKGEVVAYDESFDPLTLNDDDIVIKLEKAKDNAHVEADSGKEENVVLSDKVKHVQGYRVQIIATHDIESATFTRQRAEEQFGVMEYKTYLVYEAPQFKIRIGDAVSRSDAEKIRDLARDYGYKGAFIVRSEVIVPAQDDQ